MRPKTSLNIKKSNTLNRYSFGNINVKKLKNHLLIHSSKGNSSYFR